jgi:hypothetical protein
MPAYLEEGRLGGFAMSLRDRGSIVVVLGALSCLAACGGSSSNPDFSFRASPTTVSTVVGGTTSAIEIGASALNGYRGSVSVSLSGLPPGATTDPAFPLNICVSDDPNTAVDCAQQFTITTSAATAVGTVTLTLSAADGTRTHQATVSLVTEPLVQTSKQGTVLYLQSQANGHVARIGLDTAWGGAIVEVSMDGTNFVNRHDTGREVQPAFYDGADQYPDTGPGSAYGWDPVLGGDAYDHGSEVLQQTISSASLYTQTAPLQWWPDNFGGGASTPVTTDVTVEQTVTVVPNVPLAFKVHYKLIHNGSDTHYNSGQEFPAVYVNSTYTRFAYYGGTTPWSNGPLTTMPTAVIPTDPVPPMSYAPELWGALVDTANQGLAVFVPGQYPYEHAWGFANQSGSGPLGNTTTYMSPMVIFTIAPGAVIEGDVYLLPGDLGTARAEIYAIQQTLSGTDISAPLITVDQPTANATLSGSATISGWAFDNAVMAGLSVYVDGVATGSVSTGVARPDVANAYPHVAPPDSGWTLTLDTTKLANGAHSLTVQATDSANNVAINAPISVTVSN